MNDKVKRDKEKKGVARERERERARKCIENIVKYNVPKNGRW